MKQQFVSDGKGNFTLAELPHKCAFCEAQATITVNDLAPGNVKKNTRYVCQAHVSNTLPKLPPPVIDLPLRVVETVKRDEVEAPSGYWVLRPAKGNSEFLLFPNGDLHYIDDDKPMMRVNLSAYGLNPADL